MTGTITDPDALDSHTVHINWGPDEGTTTLNLPAGVSSFSAVHQYLDDNPTGSAADNYPVSVTVTDDHGADGSASATVTVNNVAPTDVVLSSATIDENDTFNLSGSFADIGTQDTHTVVISWGPGEGSTTLNLAAGVTSFSASHQYLDDNPTGTAFDTYAVSVTVTDDDTGADSGGTTVTVNNVAPTVADVVAPIDPVAAGSPSPVNVTSSFADVGTADSFTVVWNWGDGDTFTETRSATDPKTLSSSHFYTAAGVYTVTITVTDDDGGTASSSSGYVVIYDPSAGFVTGGGWIDSPAGAYTPDPSLTGPAHFGFVSKYKKGTSVPDGNTRFQFHAAGLDFKSTSYDWLVMTGHKARYKGTGTLNGVAGYKFLLVAVDGRQNGGGGVDRFRIKIWDSAGLVIYDNQLGASETEDPVTALGGGSIPDPQRELGLSTCVAAMRRNREIGKGVGSPTPLSLSAHDAEDVPVRVLEPGDLHVAADVDVALSRHAWHVVVLELDALGLECAGDLLDVVADHPAHCRGPIGPRVLRPVHEEFGVATLEDDQLVAFRVDRLQAERLLVELLGDIHILDRQIGDRVLVAQHGVSPQRGFFWASDYSLHNVYQCAMSAPSGTDKKSRGRVDSPARRSTPL